MTPEERQARFAAMTFQAELDATRADVKALVKACRALKLRCQQWPGEDAGDELLDVFQALRPLEHTLDD